MGLFDIFKKDKKVQTTVDKVFLGPTFLDGLTEDITNPTNLQRHEWRKRIKSASGQRKFKIKFYGKFHEDYPNLIVGSDYAPSKVVAIDPSTGQEILLFDGCKHGYNAMFCDTYSKEQIENRPINTFYKDTNGNDTFEITVSTYNGVDYDDELVNDVDDNGQIELIDGSKVDFEIAKRNGLSRPEIGLQ